MLSEAIIKRVMLSRYFFRLADDNARSDREVATFAAINLLQDSLEFFLIAAAEHVNAGVKERQPLEQYVDKIDEQISPEKLPFRPKLIQLNKIRVSAKHFGVRPDANEVKSLILVAREFFEEVARTVFKVDFWTVSLLSLLDDGETKDLLHSAEKAFEAKDYATVLIECRKAFYLEFERSYDIKMFENRDADDGLFGFGSSAPWYARNRKYIQEHVHDPFDYIVFDHDRVERDLASNRIDHAAFWNIWRLAPEVYRLRSGSILDETAVEKWVVKIDCKKLDGDGIEQRAIYVLENTIDIVLTKQLRRRATRYMSNQTNYVVSLKREEVPVYRKADCTSEVVSTTPKGVRELSVDYSCEGLKGDAIYWHISHRIGEILDPRSVSLWGYLHGDEIES